LLNLLKKRHCAILSIAEVFAKSTKEEEALIDCAIAEVFAESTKEEEATIDYAAEFIARSTALYT
jgi:hypothetical protein